MSKTSLDKSKIKFLLLEGVHQNAVDTLEALDLARSAPELTDQLNDTVLAQLHPAVLPPPAGK